MSSLNHARHAHRGRPTERAMPSRTARWGDRFVAAKPASAGRSLSTAEIAAHAAAFGCAVKAR